jgi:hypothetical protein
MWMNVIARTNKIVNIERLGERELKMFVQLIASVIDVVKQI